MKNARKGPSYVSLQATRAVGARSGNALEALTCVFLIPGPPNSGQASYIELVVGWGLIRPPATSLSPGLPSVMVL